MLSSTQLIIFEIGSKCNFGYTHKECPNFIRIPTGLYELTDEIILRSIKEAYEELNFTGLVGWHYYNEPMLQYERIFLLMEQYRNGRYILWTNGSILPNDSRINRFEQIYCTDYTGEINHAYFERCKQVSIFPAKFDNRLTDTKTLLENDKVCWRQYTEFIIDNWGTAHLCCQDWRTEIEIGNLCQDTYTTLATRRYEILKQMRKGNFPERCRKCNGKTKRVAKFDKDIRKRIINNA